jgi:hypothetical protein
MTPKNSTTMSESTSTYMLDESGKLHRAGVHIGTVNEKDEVVWTDPANSKYKAAVTRWLREEADRKAKDEDAAPAQSPAPAAADTGAGSSPPAAPAPAPAAAAPALTEKQKQKAEANSLAAEAEREGAAYRADVQDDVEFARTNNLPEPPKKHPMQGDKTPAYVEWLKEHRPGKWREKFGVKGKAQVPVIKKNDAGEEEVVGYRSADMAIRKTHLTEKIENDVTIGSDQSWDA